MRIYSLARRFSLFATPRLEKIISVKSSGELLGLISATNRQEMWEILALCRIVQNPVLNQYWQDRGAHRQGVIELTQQFVKDMDVIPLSTLNCLLDALANEEDNIKTFFERIVNELHSFTYNESQAVLAQALKFVEIKRAQHNLTVPMDLFADFYQKHKAYLTLDMRLSVAALFLSRTSVDPRINDILADILPKIGFLTTNSYSDLLYITLASYYLSAQKSGAIQSIIEGLIGLKHIIAEELGVFNLFHYQKALDLLKVSDLPENGRNIYSNLATIFRVLSAAVPDRRLTLRLINQLFSKIQVFDELEIAHICRMAQHTFEGPELPLKLLCGVVLSKLASLDQFDYKSEVFKRLAEYIEKRDNWDSFLGFENWVNIVDLQKFNLQFRPLVELIFKELELQGKITDAHRQYYNDNKY